MRQEKMQDVLIYGMVIAGSLIMLFNIVQYIRYMRKLVKQWKLERDARFLRIPIVLLVLFLLGYIFVGIFGDPDMVFVPEAPMLNVPAAAPVADPLLARFEKAGEEYAKTHTLSKETVAQLEKPMITKEAYIQIVNGNT